MSRYINNFAVLTGLVCVFLSLWIFYTSLNNQKESEHSQELINASQQEITWSAAALFAEHTRFLEQLEIHSRPTSQATKADLLDRFEIYWSRYDVLDSYNSTWHTQLAQLLKDKPGPTKQLESFYAMINKLKLDGLETLTQVEQDVTLIRPGDEQRYQAIYSRVSSLTDRIYGIQIEALSFFRELVEIRISSYTQLHNRVSSLYTVLLFTTLTGILLLSRHILQRRKVTSELKALNERLKREIEGGKTLAQKLDKQAHHDNLSGLLNRLGILRSIEDTYSSSQCVGICFIDLDLFKIVNDTAGHAAGDELIRQIASMLSKHSLDGLHLARYGGDEFLIYWPNCTQTEFERTVRRISASLSPFIFHHESKTFEVSASLGATYADTDLPSFEEILLNVDAACYEAKRLGGARVRFHDDNQFQIENRETDLDCIGNIQRSLNEGSFELYYQPIHSLSGMNHYDHSWELLIRMRDLQNNLVSPGLFLEIAEQYGLAPRIDKWVVESAIDWLEANQLERFDLQCININLSGLSLNDNEFIDYIGEKINNSSIVPSTICFEVTETSVIAKAARSNLEKLKAFGVQLALDDFGSGFSSFGYLESLPVDYLKIDGLFVQDLDTNPVHYEFVKAINAVGKSMNIKVVAEFVENHKSLEQLSAIGIDYVQGYLFGKPKPLTTTAERQILARAG